MQRAAGCSRVGRGRLVLLLLAVLSPWIGAVTGHAVLFYSTGNPNYNTNAPGGSLTNSGWQYEAFWGDFLGTPIAPNYFITASHIYVPPGTPLVFRGVSYTTITNYDDPASDLRIWRICGTFPVYAQIYTNTNEQGQSLVVIGRGTQRGTVVTTTNSLAVITNGWQWGTQDRVQRWGTNVVTAIVNGDGLLATGPIGEVLQANFDKNGGNDECHLSFADSGGAAFVRDASIWKLAGINLAVDGPYNTTNTNGDTNAFNAAIFDATGLYEKTVGGVWVPASGPGSFYATRVSAHVSWINSVINANDPAESPVLQSASKPGGPYADEMTATVDGASKSITVGLPAESRFYRLRAWCLLTIETIRIQGGDLVLTYQ